MSISYHKHHIIPKHANGSNEPSNLILLTVEEHAKAHKKLWDEHGRQEDYIAWMALSGQITKEEARRLAVSNALKGKPKSYEHRQKMSVARKKRGGITTGMKLPPCSDERKARISKANMGRISPMKGEHHSEETKILMSESAKKRVRFECVVCGKIMTKALLVQWHGLNGQKCSLRRIQPPVFSLSFI